VKWGAVGLLVILMWAGGLSLAADSAGIKAANSWSGLTSPLLGTIRRIADRDGDGFAAILGGGDCNDRDPKINPLAVDIPGDGIDQNCTGADAPPLPPAPAIDPGLPNGIPADLNILLITMDCVRAGHLGTYGYGRPTTPSLDKLARKSAVFENAWSNSSYTIPSVATIMTGRYVSQVRWAVQSEKRAIAPDNGVLGDIMRRAGAMTGAIGWSTPTLVNLLGLGRSFDDDMWPKDTSGVDDFSDAPVPATADRHTSEGRPSVAREQAELAMSWMKGRIGRRFFLWVHFIDTHPPYSHHPGTPEFGTDDNSLADHDLRFTEGQVGRILDWLNQTGLGRRTAVFVTSDHGTHHGKPWLPPQWRYLYPEYTRVPMIVRIPGLLPRRIPEPISHVDILPTIAQLAGVSISIPLPGRSLLRLMARGADGHLASPIYQMVDQDDQQRRAIVDASGLLIHNILPESTYEKYDAYSARMDRLQDQYNPIRDSSLRESLSRLEDANQVPLPAWIP
jgi:hypothetical protein